MDLLSDLLNDLFAVTPRRLSQRRFFILSAAVGIWITLGVLAHPPSMLPQVLRSLGDFFTSLVQFPFRPDGLYDAIIDGLKTVVYGYFLLREVLAAVFALDVLRHIIALFVPFFLAFRIAVIYLDDIFELHNEKIAFQYLLQAAFGIRPYSMTIENGSIAAGDKDSPLLRIGGPGRVQVNLENVAVFDRTDGSPHLVGPTVRHRDLVEPLDAFERLRDIIDLRDQMTRANEISLEGRTRDGIRIAIRDIRMVFSVARSGPRAANSGGYSYRPEGILRLAYERGGGPWAAVMVGLVRKQLQDFIASHTLSEVLATIGLPEIEEQINNANRVDQKADSLFPKMDTGFISESQPVPIPKGTPNFVSRVEITNLFHDPAHGFPAKAAARGLQLHWIDVGTWVMPSSVIPEMQLDAWRMSTENEARRREQAELEDQSRLDELLRLVREVPLITYAQAQEAGKPPEQTTAEILADYLGLLRSAADVYEREEKPLPEKLEGAIRLLSRYLNEHYKASGQARYLTGGPA